MFNKLITFILLFFTVICNACNTENSEDCNVLDKNSLTSLIAAVGRSVTTSKVVTVNLKNAAILAGIKAIVIIAGLLGKLSFWTFPKLGNVRKIKPFEQNLVDDIEMSLMANEDMRWAAAYMWSLNKADFGCFYRLACENPYSAIIYSKAAVILRDISSYFGLFKQKKFYQKIMSMLDQAAINGLQSGINCRRYQCRSPFKRG